MKKILLAILFMVFAFQHQTLASCAPGFSEVIVVIVPDTWPQETSWNITDNSGTTLASGLAVGDTICIPTSSCVVFTIYDTFGDGIYAPGGYWVYVDGALVATGNSFGTMAQIPIACPPGMFCSSPLPLSFGTYTASYDNTFYSVTPAVTGTYNFTTCGLNTCDTKIWIYASCSGQMIDEGPPGTYAFNDNANCGLQASLDVVLMAGQT
nr:hypothetical protein [Bacteroidia bacterium]